MSASPSLPYNSSISEISRSCVRPMLGLAQQDIISSVVSKSSTSQGTEKSLNAPKQSNLLSSTSIACYRTRPCRLNCVPRSSTKTSPEHHSSTHGPLHRIHGTSHIRCVLWPWSWDVTKEKTRSHEQDDASIQSGNPSCCTHTPLAKRSYKSEMREVRKCVRAP